MSWLPVLLVIVLVGAAAASAGARQVVWVEAERFDEPGGWTADTQFIDQMGSPYLLAVGLGTPVADATTKVSVPRPGRYRLWARTRDWAPPHRAGRFQIAVDGKPLDHEFGACGQPGWRWEDGGTLALKATHELRLHDLTGFYGRCDAIVLSDDLAWPPPAAKAAIARLREQHGGVSATVADAGEHDVVVVGGGLAGCLAAVSAARTGARTALIQNRSMLGGNASPETIIPPVGVWPGGKHKPGPLDPRESGLLGEIRTIGNQRTAEALSYPHRLLRLVEAEPTLRLFLNTHATGVEMKSPDTIGAVLTVNVRDGQRLRFRGREFIDCTGDAVIGVAARAEVRHGREPRSMYDEKFAPQAGDRRTMGNSIKYISKPTDAPQPYTPPPWAMKFPHCEDFAPGRHPRLGGDIGWQWMIELGGNRDTYADAEEIRDDLLRLVYGIWDHVKNHCPQHREAAESHALTWVGYVAGKRENRRLIGAHVLTEGDIAGQTLFPDRVAYGGWSLDDHHPDGFFHRGKPVRIAGEHQHFGHRFAIPYRSVYSKNIANLLMAGRNISATHVALSDTRVMLTCAVIGQAVGAAAGLCIEHATTPRGVYQRHLDTLQQRLLKDGAWLIDLPNRDPHDLARKARATASSEATPAANAIDGYARAEHGGTHAWAPAADAAAPHWLELAWDAPQALNVVHVTFLTQGHVPKHFAVQVAEGDGWRTVAEVGRTRHRRHTLAFERTKTTRLRLVLDGPAAKVAVCEVRAYDEPTLAFEAARRAQHTKHLPDPPIAVPWMPAGLDARKLPGIVLDSSQAEAEGQWDHSTFAQPYVGDGYLHDGNEAKGDKSLRFPLRVPAAGRYEIRFAFLAYTNRATNTPIAVITPQGEKIIRINQRQKPPIDGLWLSLGTFELKPGDEAAVVIRNAGTDGYVVVDAVQLLPAKP